MWERTLERRRGIRLFVLFSLGFVAGEVLQSATQGALWAFPGGNLVVFGLGASWAVRQRQGADRRLASGFRQRAAGIRR